MKKAKVKALWIVLTSVSALLLVAVIIGSVIANSYGKTLNDYFNTQDWRYEQTDTDKKVDSEYFKSDYVKADGSYDGMALWSANEALADEVQTEGTTLLWNGANGLPLSSGNKVSLFGRTSTAIYASGAGSGASISSNLNMRSTFTAAGLSVNATLWNFYTSGDGKGYDTETSKTVNEVPWSRYTTSVKNSFSEYGDCAVFVIGRYGSEKVGSRLGDFSKTSADTITGDYLELHQNEKDVIEQIISLKNEGVFNKFVVLLNTPGSFNFNLLGEYRNDIDCCMWMGQPGYQGLSALGKIFVGESIPSGHLPDTFAYNNQSAPAVVNNVAKQWANKNSFTLTNDTWQSTYMFYLENIYVGYKYYETRYEDVVLGQGNASSSVGVYQSTGGSWNYAQEVAFPFGYGASYTSFEYTVDDDDFVTKNADGTYSVKVTVKNVGSANGKDAVQVYSQRPYTQYDKDNLLEQAAVNLCGYAKTRELAPNESQTLIINIDRDAFITYDDMNKKTYIQEAGTYYLSVGQDAHDAVNNILAKKGKTTANSAMDKDGDASLVWTMDIAENDYTTYSVSRYTNKQITNRLEQADWNKYVNNGGQTVKYLSRSDWQNTWPVLPNINLNSALFSDLEWGKDVVEDPDAKFPTYGKSSALNLISLKGEPYESKLWDELLDKLTLDDQAELLSNCYCGTPALAAINKPGEVVSDGPLGVKKKYLDDDVSFGHYNMSYPISPLLAATFNDDLAERVGVMKGEDMLQTGTSGIYAPGSNIHRTAYGGRNYEYYSEDGFLSGKMGAMETRGIQSKGGYVTLKHFLLNDGETNRFGVAIWGREQAIREIYCEAFEDSVGNEKAGSLMSSFTRVGAVWSGANRGLQTDILRNEWGFKGFVISDCSWFTYMDVIDGVLAGNDNILYSKQDATYGRYLEVGKNSPTVAQAMRESCHRILYVVVNSSAMNGISINTKIVPAITWWQFGLIAIQSVIGLITLALALILIFDVLNTSRINKLAREAVQNGMSNGETDKIKGNIAAVTKQRSHIKVVAYDKIVTTPKGRAIAICSIMLAAVIAVSATLTSIAVSGGLFIDKNAATGGGSSANGGYYDDATIYKIEAENGTMLGAAKATSEAESNNPSGGKFVGGLRNNKDAGFSIAIDSAAADKVIIGFSFGGRTNEAIQFNKAASLIVNDAEVKVANTVILAKGAFNWFDWKEYDIAEVELTQGRNTISIINSRGGEFSNVDYIYIKSNHEITEITPPVKHSYRLEAELATLGGGATAIWYSSSETYNPSGGGYVDMGKADRSIEYTLNSDRDALATLYFSIGRRANWGKYSSSIFTVTVNGTDVTKILRDNDHYVPESTNVANDELRGWYDWGEYLMQDIQLSEGENVIKMTTKMVASNVDYVTLKTEADITGVAKTYNFEAEGAQTNCGVRSETNSNNPSGGKYVDMNGVGKYITLTVVSDKEVTATVAICMGRRTNLAKYMNSIFSVSVNGTDVSERIEDNDHYLKAVADRRKELYSWFDWQEVLLQTIQLKKGENVIKLETKIMATNVDYVTIIADAALS